MYLEETSFKGLYIVHTTIMHDDRGYFEKIFNKNFFKTSGLCSNYVDINHSKTLEKGVFRGFHYQVGSMSETKIIRCLSGRVKDYVIDMRKNSKTFLKIYSVELSEYNKLMLYIPEGFAHGFQALENNTEAIYLSSNSYSKEHEIVINPNDILFNINFDFKLNLSQKDNQAPFIDDLSRYVV